MNNIQPNSAQSLNLQNDQASNQNKYDTNSLQANLIRDTVLSSLSVVAGQPSVSSSNAPGSSTWDPSALTQQWADMEAAGLCAFLHRMENSANPDANGINWAKTKLQSIIDKSANLDPSIKTIAQGVIKSLGSADPKSAINSYWIVENADKSDGPVTTIWKTLQGFLSKDPISLEVPNDDGTGQFLITTLFADFGSLKISDPTSGLSTATGKCFGYYDGGIDSAASCYALQDAAYLLSQGFSTSDLTSVASSFSYAAEGTNYQIFDTNFQQVIKDIVAAGGMWPKHDSKGIPYPTLADVKSDANSLWDNWTMSSNK
jgi:hypothetical protein